MGIIEVAFPVTAYWYLTDKSPSVEEEVYDSVQELEEDLEWMDTRGNDYICLVDSNGGHFDIRLNWLLGEPTEFYKRESVPLWLIEYKEIRKRSEP